MYMYIYTGILLESSSLLCVIKPVDAIHRLRQLLNNLLRFSSACRLEPSYCCFIYTKNTPYCFPCLHRPRRAANRLFLIASLPLFDLAFRDIISPPSDHYRLYLDGIDVHGAEVERVIRVWVLVSSSLAASRDVVDIQVTLVDGVCRSHYMSADAIYADLSVDICAAFG
jgi:hypothetical protein